MRTQYMALIDYAEAGLEFNADKLNIIPDENLIGLLRYGSDTDYYENISVINDRICPVYVYGLILDSPREEVDNYINFRTFIPNNTVTEIDDSHDFVIPGGFLNMYEDLPSFLSRNKDIITMDEVWPTLYNCILRHIVYYYYGTNVNVEYPDANTKDIMTETLNNTLFFGRIHDINISDKIYYLYTNTGLNLYLPIYGSPLDLIIRCYGFTRFDKPDMCRIYPGYYISEDDKYSLSMTDIGLAICNTPELCEVPNK